MDLVFKNIRAYQKFEERKRLREASQGVQTMNTSQQNNREDTAQHNASENDELSQQAIDQLKNNEGPLTTEEIQASWARAFASVTQS